MLNRVATAALILIAGLSPFSASARFTGQTLGWQYYYKGGKFLKGNKFVVTKKSAIGGQFKDEGLVYFNIISDRHSVTFSYEPMSMPGTWSSSPLSLAPTIYNGIALNLLSSGSFRSVKIDPKTNMAGFDASRLSFTKNQIQVDWQNLSYTKATIVKLDIKVTGISANTIHREAVVDVRLAGANTP